MLPACVRIQWLDPSAASTSRLSVSSTVPVRARPRGSLPAFTAEVVAGQAPRVELVHRYRPVERSADRQIAPAARVEEPCTERRIRGFEPLLPLHRFQD